LRKMRLSAWAVLAAASSLALAQAQVRVEPVNLNGPRTLDQVTQNSAIRNYLDAWKNMSAALGENRSELLDQDFVGTARDKLGDTIRQQTNAGVHTAYTDRSHDLQIVFYSPDGLSIELIDKVEYDVQLVDHADAMAARHVTAKYAVVLTPAEARWKVRVFQAATE
jgi:hypothetical protein